MSIRIEKRLITVRLGFDFQKYIKLILSNLPSNDLIGIRDIRIVEKFSNPKKYEDTVACYSAGKNPRAGAIEIHLPKFMEYDCPRCIFQFHREIAAYRLSFTLCHEVGHHVHHVWRHGVKKPKEERFANKYSVAGGFAYLQSRSSKILSAFKWAGRNFLVHNRQERRAWRKERQDIIDWRKKNREGIRFP
jgi:hypothetical protein